MSTPVKKKHASKPHERTSVLNAHFAKLKAKNAATPPDKNTRRNGKK